MSVAAQIAKSERKGRKPATNRKDADKQEQTFKRTELATREEHLVQSFREMKEATEQFSDDVKAAAEACGLNASAVRRYIVAKAGDDFDEAKRKVEQLALAFDV